MSKPWIDAYDKQVSANLSYPDVPLYTFLTQAAKRFPEHPCLSYQGFQLSYREVDDLVDRLACGLKMIGVQKGDRIGLIMGNIPQFVISFYAILKAGAIVVATNPLYKERELLFQLRNSGCKTVITIDTSLELLNKVQPQTSIVNVIHTSLDDYKTLSQQVEPFEKDTLTSEKPELYFKQLFCKNTFDLKQTINIEGDDPAIFQYSGGTTGTPKAAIGLHRNLVSNTLQFRKWLFDLEDGKEAVIAAIPLYHVYGMVIGMSMGIALGANLILIDNPKDIANILQMIEKYQATLFPGVPNMYQSINRYPGVEGYDLTSIKACISGSAPLLSEVKQEFERITGGKLLEGYGLSEAPTATHCNPYMGENRTGSIGLPLPDVDCRIVSLDDGITDVQPGEAGELLIRGPQVMQGYHDMIEETEQALADGWLHTGDIARMDTRGYFYLIDRKKDVIKAGGFQVWPREVEEVIADHPAVLEAAVAGVIDPQRGETVHAWIVLLPEKQLTVEQVRSWCKERLVHYKVPVKVEFILQLPRTGVGKILRRELVRQYQEKIQSID